MNLTGNTILITGGASGIGLALARRFLAAGSDVIVCGRREAALRDAQARHPTLQTFVGDVATAAGRQALVERALRDHPAINVLVNNAGVQRYLDLADPAAWPAASEEIAINLEAPVHLSMLFAAHLRAQPHPAIINVTSGLSFAPLAKAPVYCATKAAMHSFTQSLRHQLAATPIAVIEIVPPAVNTDLGGPGLHTFGVALDEFADAAMAGLAEGHLEIAYGFALQASRASREELTAMFTRMNAT